MFSSIEDFPPLFRSFDLWDKDVLLKMQELKTKNDFSLATNQKQSKNKQFLPSSCIVKRVCSDIYSSFLSVSEHFKANRHIVHQEYETSMFFVS